MQEIELRRGEGGELTGWELFKILIKGAGIYQKKLVIFLILVLAGFAGLIFWQRENKISATAELAQSSVDFANNKTLDVVVSKNGQVTVNGKQAKNAVSFLKDYDELSIIAFNKPETYISTFQATVHLPAPSDSTKIRQLVHSAHGVSSYQNFMTDPQTLVYQANEISPQATLTIVAYFPKGYLQPSVLDSIKLRAQNFPIKIWLYIAIVLPLIALIIMGYMMLLRQKSTVFASKNYFPSLPQNLKPGIVGVMVDGICGAREIAATLIDLASRGYIFIINKGEGNFSFGVRKSGDVEKMEGLQIFEQALLSKIFLPRSFKSTPTDIEMRIGRHIFSRKIAQFYLELYNKATSEGYFVKNPAKVHLFYKYLGIGLFFLSFLGFLFGAVTGADPKFSLVFWVGGMVAAVVIIKMSPFMPARTAKGTAELQNWLAFRRYLVTPQRADATDFIQEKYLEYMPYAIVLGAEIEWTRRFSQEPFKKPDWYESPEPAVTLESFAGQIFPLIGFVAKNLARSHEPTVE